MMVDSFKFLPRLIARFYQLQQRAPVLPIPWTPLFKPVSESCFTLLTSGGLYHRSHQSPFDVRREKNQPTWGDPSYRIIPKHIPQAELGVSHLHYNPQAVLRDINVLLPVKHFSRLALEGRIGSLSTETYSVMGYQGYPPDTRTWESKVGVEIAKRMISNGVNCVILVPA